MTGLQSDVHDVVVVGGASRMTGLRGKLEAMFPAHYQTSLHMTDATINAVSLLLSRQVWEGPQHRCALSESRLSGHSHTERLTHDCYHVHVMHVNSHAVREHGGNNESVVSFVMLNRTHVTRASVQTSL